MFRIVFAPLLALSLAATALAAQDTARTTVGGKDPTAARVLGIVPGAGHVYAGETLTGMRHFATTGGIFLIALLSLAGDCLGDYECDESVTPGLVTLAGFGYWGWTIYDAGRAAERANARRRFRLSLIAAPGGSTLVRGSDAQRIKLGFSVDAR